MCFYIASEKIMLIAVITMLGFKYLKLSMLIIQQVFTDSYLFSS